MTIKMKQKRISGGSARLGQLMLLLFFSPFIVLLIYLMLAKNLSSEGIIFTGLLLAPIILIVYNSFRFGDIYLLDETLIIRKLFTTEKKPIAKIVNIETTLFPFAFHLKFDDMYKVMFFSKTADIFKQIISNKPSTLKEELKSKLSSDN